MIGKLGGGGGEERETRNLLTLCLLTCPCHRPGQLLWAH